MFAHGRGQSSQEDNFRVVGIVPETDNKRECLDAERLFAEITKAETTIRTRKLELLQESATDADELAAIARALKVLAQLREIEHTS